METHDYPNPVSGLLAETVALAAMLSSPLKYDGMFTLQAQGDGALRLLMADVTSDGEIRACAQLDAEAMAARITEPGDGMPHFMAAGHLGFTVDQGPDTGHYQGITEPIGSTISDCAHTYFRQSEQMETVVVLMAKSIIDATPAASLIIQWLPTLADRNEDAWRCAVALMRSAKANKLLYPDLPPGKLL